MEFDHSHEDKLNASLNDWYTELILFTLSECMGRKKNVYEATSVRLKPIARNLVKKL